jgi:hypothetical protein
MKKLLTIAFAMLLGATLSFAQATGSTDKTGTGKTDTKTASSTSTKSGKKGSTKTAAKKKGKKSPGGTTTPAPK